MTHSSNLIRSLRAQARFILFATVAFVAAGDHVVGQGAAVWTTGDVGAPSIRGTAQSVPCAPPVSAGGIASSSTGAIVSSLCSALAITVGGAGFGGSADQVTFVYQKLSGDGSISVRLQSLSGLSASMEAGVMLRDTLRGDARQVSLTARRAGTGALRWRTATGGSMQAVSAPASVPGWLKLERAGATVSAFVSGDGSQWTAVGSASMALPDTIYVGVAATSGDPASAAVAMVTDFLLTSSPGNLPEGWSSADIGVATQAGFSASSGNIFLGLSTGVGVSSAGDHVRFIYTRVLGDVELVARVLALQGSTQRQAGLMFRDSLQSSAQDTSLFLSVGKVWTAGAAGGSPRSIAAGRVPLWLKLDRRGAVTTAWYSSDGVSWKVAGTQAASTAAQSYIGLFVAAGQATRVGRAAAAIDSVSVRANSANLAPTVSLISPTVGRTFAVGESVTVAASASDPDDRVVKVDFYVGSNKIGTDTTEPFSVAWKPAAAGTYGVAAVAVDTDGATANSGIRKVFVSATVTASSGTSASGSGTSAPSTTTSTSSGSTSGSTTSTSSGSTSGSATRTSSGTTSGTTSSTGPWWLGFEPSFDHAQVLRYELELFRVKSGSLSQLVVSKNLAKPQPVQGVILVNVDAVVSALPAGQYGAAVKAVAGTGSTRSDLGYFVR